MPILDAALAFALTMLAVSTAVAYIVRSMQSMVGLRASELKKMLVEFFDKELEPVVQTELAGLEHRATETAADELSKMAKTCNLCDLISEDDLKKLVEVSTEDLTLRLKQSDLGKRLMNELGEKAESVFDKLGKRYELIGAKFTKSFRDSSKKWATVVAAILAFVLNIDCVRIANSYLNNESSRKAVIAQQDKFKSDYDTLIKTVEKDKENNEPVTKEELVAALNEGRDKVSSLSANVFPIGWSYYPYPYLSKSKAQLAEDNYEEFDAANLPMWFFGIILTAFLTGFGAPFWYDVVAGITRVSQKAGPTKPST